MCVAMINWFSCFWVYGKAAHCSSNMCESKISPHGGKQKREEEEGPTLNDQKTTQ
jgi:hypothetical protein